MKLSSVFLSLALCLWSLMAWTEESVAEFGDPATDQGVRPLIRAHAHNDYYHQRPLLDALSRGFCSVEADVFLVDGLLLVGHSRSELKVDRRLETLYLDPLLERVRENGGRVFQNGPAFTLLIDIKADGEETYAALDDTLTKYHEMLSIVTDGVVQRNAVTIVVSGDRAWEAIESDPTRYVGVDGRFSDLASQRPKHLMPMVSDNWERIFEWAGEGPMPDSERADLRRIVDQAHASGRRVRFWATPDHPSPARTAVWAELVSAGVDSIGTDDLDGLKSFLHFAEIAGR